ncbi:phospholipase/carboxylesterase [Coniochaeta sp. 2T2.1]|nr:phospholipase/carboxylesterase [Coniochaeta sp. 2T2.1]
MSQQTSASASASPAPFVVHPLSAHTHTLILLHGLGSNGENFGRALLKTGVTSTGQYPSYRKETQLQGLEESARETMDILRLEQTVGGIAPENIILGGLSQGCAMSLSVLLCLDHQIGGFVGMSGYLPFRDDIDEAVAEASADDDDENPFAGDEDAAERPPPAVRASIFERDLLGFPAVDDPAPEKTAHGTPIFLGHGSADNKVPCSLGESASTKLTMW